MSEWKVAANSADIVGEGPLWIASEKAIYWVDIVGQAIRRLSLEGGDVQSWTMPEVIGFVVECRDQAGFIVGLQSGVYRVTLAPLTFTFLRSLGKPEPNHRLNDAAVDDSGNLWIGTMALDGSDTEGKLYCLKADMTCVVADGGYQIPNGPAFNAHGTIFYHADSPQRIIYRFDVIDGQLNNKRPHIIFEDSDWGLPDGMTVDAEDHLWVAHWDGGRVSRFDPEGKVERIIALPVSRVTSCAFAGEKLDRLFVTSARHERSNEELAGALFEFEVNVCGIQQFAFAG